MDLVFPLDRITVRTAPGKSALPRRGLSWGLFLVLLFAQGRRTCLGQVVLDGKFGSSGALSGPNYSIPATVGAVRGNNLFHSFAQFDLVAKQSATFSGPANIQNILSRVTGGKPSSIDGTIRSEIAGANLFLMNPNGILFGPNASIDVSGAFAATTANYLKLADGARFVASLDADDSALSTAPVSAFGFLGSNPGTIEVQQSALKVGEGKSVTLIGGDITLDGGSVQAPAGQIQAVSVKSAGEVPVNPAGLTRADFRTAFPEEGQVNLRNGAGLDASGEGGGRIVIRGGRLTVDNSKVEANTTGATAGQGIDVAVAGKVEVVNGGQINALSKPGLAAGGSIHVSAQSVHMDGFGLVDETFTPLTQISAATGELFAGGGPGRGGDIVVETGELDLFHGAQISSVTYGAGDAGRIDIKASSVRLDAQLTAPTQITANTMQNEGGGKAGDILIHTDTFDLQNGATMLATSFGTGQAGVIHIDAADVNVKNAGIITAASFGPGSGGNVEITAKNVHLDGRDTLTGGPDLLTGVQAVTTSFDTPAPGGSIRVQAETVKLEHNGSLFTSSYGLGPGGNIEIKAGQVSLANASTIRATGEADGPAGKIAVRSAQDVLLSEASAITTSALLSSGGDIQVQAGRDLQLFGGSQINAQAGPGGGGNITTLAPGLVYLLDSTFTAQAVGDGGNLNVTQPVFFIINNSALVSKSTSANGGNITILSDYFFQSGSIIDASAPFGLPGTVIVSAPEVDLSGTLIGLPGNLLSLETELRPDCGVRLSEDISSFILLGRGGLPLVPGGFVPSGTPLLKHETR